MTVLLVSEVFPPKTGGSGRWFWEIYRRLPRGRVIVAAGEDAKQNAFDRANPLRLRRLPLNVPGRGVTAASDLHAYWRALRLLRHLIHEHSVNVVHCGRCLPEGLMAWMLKLWAGVPYVCYAHGEEVNLPMPGQPAGPGMMCSRQLRWLTRVVLHGADYVIANCRNTVRILRDGWGLPSQRVRLLYPGVDTGLFVPVPRDDEVRSRLGWGQRPVIVTVARLQKRKGHERMIRALLQVRKTHSDVLYAIIGDGEERSALEQLVSQLGLGHQVQFHGEVNDAELLHCYQQCDLFVLPNRQIGSDIEGFGMVLLEAQSCGRPVVAGRSGGTAETMRVPETGRLVDTESPDGLAHVVGGLLGNEVVRLRMGHAARNWVEQQFDWAVLSQQAARMFWPGRSYSEDALSVSQSVAVAREVCV